jgi:hypothetical protein
MPEMAIPTPRAIRYKSGLAPTNTLRAFRFYPYCFASAAATHIVHPSGRVALPHPGLIDELGFVIQSEFLKTSILHRNK